MLKLAENIEHNDKDKTKQCCENPDIVEVDYEMVCKSCGCVVDKRFENSSRRIYNMEDVKNRKMNEPVRYRHNYWTTFNPNENVQRSPNSDTPSTSKFNRLKKIQISYTDTFGRNMALINPILGQLKNILHIPDYIIEQTKRYYCIAIKRSIIKGRSVKAFIFASLICSVRQNKFPLTQDQILDIYSDLTDISTFNRDVLPKTGTMDEIRKETLNESKQKKQGNIYRRNISRACQVLIPYIRKEFPTHIITLVVDPSQIINITANKLNISQQNINKCMDFYRFIRKSGFQTSGINPKGIAIAIMYIVLKRNKVSITQNDLAKVGIITEVTLRNIMKKIRDFISAHNLQI